MIKKVFLGILICCLFALLGCEAEKDFIEKSGTEQKYQLRRINFTEFKSNHNAFQKLKETCFKKSSNLKSKGVYNDDYGVFIDTTSIVVIEKGEKHSITFQIMDEEVSGKIENLVLSLKENGEYSAYITKYLLSEQEIQTLGRGQTIGDKYPATITQVENNSTENVSQTDGCINHYYETSSYCRDSNGEVIFSAGYLGDGCVGTSWTVTYLVIDISPGCGGSSPGSGYGGPSNGSGGDGGNGGGGSSGGSSGSSPGNPGNPSNGNGSNPGHGDPVFTTPVLNTNASKTFVLGLSAEQRNWWDSEAPEQVKTEIKNYIDQHPNKEVAFNFAEEMIDTAIANLVISFSPFLKYPVGSNYKILYPEFTFLVEEYIPTLKNDTRLINVMTSLTGLSGDKVKKNLIWGNGPEINIVQLGLAPDGTEIKGKFSTLEPDKIYIDIDLVQYLENYAIQNGESNELGRIRALITFSVCLHELVHHADFDYDQLMQDNVNLELGELFETLYIGGFYEFDGQNNVILIKPKP